MENGKHIINKVFLEVNTHSIETAYHLKDNLDVFLKETILPYLEAYFDTFQKTMSPVDHLQIEKIAMDLSFGASLNFTDLKEDIKRGIENELENIRRTNIKKHLSSSEKRAENTFIHFFDRGMLPWWSDSKGMAELYNEKMFALLLKSNDFKSELLKNLRQAKFRERFIKQLNDNQLLVIYKSFLALKADVETTVNVTTINNLVKNVKSKDGFTTPFLLMKRYLVWEIALGALIKIEKVKLKSKLVLLFKHLESHFGLTPKTGDESVLNRVYQLIDYENSDELLQTLTDLLSKYSEERNTSNSVLIDGSKKKRIKYVQEVFDDKEAAQEKMPLTTNEEAFLLPKESGTHEPSSGYYMENAGLMLLHPYLKQLFINCKLLEGSDIAHPEIAVHLLHYTATQQEMQYEHQMMFEKFLCNIPWDQPINRNIKLSSDLKLQAEEMLRAALHNWPEMKKASLELLRHEYLQRVGKLVLSEDNPKVIVERKTQDILLDKLPWNIGLCKLPWKNKIIFTDW